MRKCRKLAMLCLCMLVIVCQSIVSRAGKIESMQPRMSYITLATATLTISSGGTASASTFVSANGMQNISIKMILQKKSGSNWVSINVWESSCVETSSKLMKNYVVTKGTYRVLSTIRVNTETKSVLSTNQTY